MGSVRRPARAGRVPCTGYGTVIDGLSDAQRNLLFKLVIGGEPVPLRVAESRLRKPLVERGLAELIPHPTNRRAKLCVATETGWAWLVDHIDAPIENASVRLRDAWNPLVKKLSAYLEARGENLATVLSASPEPPAPSVDAIAPPETLHRAYRALAGRQERARIRIADLRQRAGLAPDVFDRALDELVRARRVAVFPEDDRAELRAADHEGAFMRSGVPMHIVYWER